MEQNIRIQLPNSKKAIYGKLRGSITQPLIIFVHGLTGYMDHHLFFNGARFFERFGFSSFRFNLYSWEPDARRMVETSIHTHAADLDTIVAYFRNEGASRVHVVGHSFGGTTILYSKERLFDTATLWDPVVRPGSFWESVKFIRTINAFRFGGLFNLAAATFMLNQARTVKPRTSLLERFPIPTSVMLAEESDLLVRVWERYFTEERERQELVVIPGADHAYDKDDSEMELFSHTLRWIRSARTQNAPERVRLTERDRTRVRWLTPRMS